MECQIESGVQFFARLTARVNIKNLHSRIFKNGGPFPNEIIEVSGDSSAGKTSFIMEMIAYTILPSTFQNILINGKNASAILIDSEHHFDLQRLVKSMQIKLKLIANINPDEIKFIISESLKRLIICNVFSLFELKCTFIKVGSMIHDNSNIALVCFDSIQSFYWCERDFNNNKLAKDQFKYDYLKYLIDQIKDYNVVLAYTRSTNFKSNQKYKRKQEIPIHYKINLIRNLGTDMAVANIQYKSNPEYTVKFRLKNCFQLNC